MIDDEADNASINTLLHQDKVKDQSELGKSYHFSVVHPYRLYRNAICNIFIDPDTEDEMGNDDLFH